MGSLSFFFFKFRILLAGLQICQRANYCTHTKYINFNKISPQYPAWIEQCTGEDLSFARRMILASGSLKELAAQHDVSYPTIRLRLDRLIEKIKLVE